MRESTINVADVIRSCQLKVASTYVHQGDSHALVALACASITLQAYIEAGSLTASALDHLDETATNLGLAKRLGREFVAIALDAGPLLFDGLADAVECRQATTIPAPTPMAVKAGAEFELQMAPGGAMDRILMGRSQELARGVRHGASPAPRPARGVAA